MVIEETNLCEDIVKAYDEYIALLEKEIQSVIGLAVAHGYTGNETGYHEGVRLRAKIQDLKNAIEQYEEQHDIIESFLTTLELTSLKGSIIRLLNNSDIAVLSYFRYPSVVRHNILSTHISYNTKEHDWLTGFAERMFKEVLPKHNIPIDNKIAIEIKPLPKNIKKNHEDNCSMWFGSRDGAYCIGLNAENMDGYPAIEIS
jgi:hypothetical protein